MKELKMEQNAIPVGVGKKGLLKWCPAIRLETEKDFRPISNQGNIICYETREEALKYFEEQ